MTIVMISNNFQGRGEELAQALADKTRWPMLSRQELQDQARKLGIKVGRLEVSMIKRMATNEKLAREKRLYLAFLNAALCEKARNGNLIYTGLAGNLLLPGVSHRVRVGLTAPRESRIQRTAKALNMSADKAGSYLSRLDEDVDRWIRNIHQVDARDPNAFDLFLNLENMSLSHAVDIVYQTAVLTDYQATPESIQLLDDMLLAAQAKLRLAFDDRTHAADLQVQAEKGVLTVTYPPHQESISGHITKVLGDLESCREILCTMAETNILWVQERFDSDSDNFRQILQLAQRWGAAVELMRLLPMDELLDADAQDPNAERTYSPGPRPTSPSCGFEEDDSEAVEDDGGLEHVQEELVSLGRCGGRRTVYGGYSKILERVQGDGQYALVVIGDVFLSKGHSARTRLTRELAMNIRDRLKAPVITSDEMKSRFLFGPRQALTLLGFLALLVVLYGSVLTHQDLVINFLSGSFHENYKWLGSATVFIFIPIIAYLYGTVTDLALKIINVD